MGLVERIRQSERISAIVTCAAWVIQEGYPDLAFAMRDEFLREWHIEPSAWNKEIQVMIDYVRRQGIIDAIPCYTSLLIIRFQDSA